ncbi:lactadherin-like [Amphiura filiformis]|uniref:lactadherin-like n=1 Tax=Amphiura filiformis TaxID=82378 RepID=UPI003B22809B
MWISWGPCFGCPWRQAIILLQILYLLPELVRAHPCYVGQEKDRNNVLRWVLPYAEPCRCTSVQFGGSNYLTSPKRAFALTYLDKALLSKDVTEIRRHYGIQCSVDATGPSITQQDDIIVRVSPAMNGSYVYWNESTATDNSGSKTHSPGSFFAVGINHVTYTFVDQFGNKAQMTFIVEVIIESNCGAALGMESGRIKDNQITASSSYEGWSYGPENARLNKTRVTGSSIGGWCALRNNDDQWIQVNLMVSTTVRGIITQGREDKDQWVTEYKVQSSSDGDSWTWIGVHASDATTINALVFIGNSNRSTPVTNYFTNSVEAKFVRIRPTAWISRICLRFELLGYEGNPLGMANGNIIDDQITASSEYKSRSVAYDGRLNQEKAFVQDAYHLGCWLAGKNDNNQWIQVNLMLPKLVTGLVTQGRPDVNYPRWVTQYQVQYGNDGRNWQYVMHAIRGNPKEFAGNSDYFTPVTRYFDSPVETTYIRIIPTQWHTRISMRFEILGCDDFPNYLGCFHDNDDHALPSNLYISSAQTLSKCFKNCRAHGKRYAGVQYGTHCFCGGDGLSYDKYGIAASEADCDVICSGSELEKCGGRQRNNVYDLWGR